MICQDFIIYLRWTDSVEMIVLLFIVCLCHRIRTDTGKSRNLKFTFSMPGNSWYCLGHGRSIKTIGNNGKWMAVSRDSNYIRNMFWTSLLLSWIWKMFESKGKVFPYSLPSVGPGADPGGQAVSPQVTFKSSPSGRLPLLSARPVVTFPAEEHHRPSTSTKLYCLVTEAHRCEQLA